MLEFCLNNINELLSRDCDVTLKFSIISIERSIVQIILWQILLTSVIQSYGFNQVPSEINQVVVDDTRGICRPRLGGLVVVATSVVPIYIYIYNQYFM